MVSKRSIEAASHTPYKYLTFNQLIALLEHKNATINEFRLASLNLKKNYLCLLNKANDYKRMMRLIASSDTPRLNSLLNTFMRQGHGMGTICDKIKQAIDGCFKNKAFSEKEKDLGILVLRIGGPRLLWTFNKLNMLPSKSLVSRMLNGKITMAFGYD